MSRRTAWERPNKRQTLFGCRNRAIAHQKFTHPLNIPQPVIEKAPDCAAPHVSHRSSQQHRPGDSHSSVRCGHPSPAEKSLVPGHVTWRQSRARARAGCAHRNALLAFGWDSTSRLLRTLPTTNSPPLPVSTFCREPTAVPVLPPKTSCPDRPQTSIPARTPGSRAAP